jgi:hypothetical protein
MLVAIDYKPNNCCNIFLIVTFYGRLAVLNAMVADQSGNQRWDLGVKFRNFLIKVKFSTFLY